jgi:carboxyl-terminal processing protease
MPRRNLYWLLAVGVFSLICYQKVQTNRYGRIMADAVNQVERHYIEPVEPSSLFEGAMVGMMSRLDDPYSEYISPKMLREFNETIDQEFGGAGMQVSLEEKTRQLTVTSPLVGTPAYRAGVRAGDKILRIDDQSTQGLSLPEAVKRMRGKVGDPVTLTVLHEGEEKPVEIKIVREIIHVDSVLGDTRNADGSWNYFLEGPQRIGYLRINTFAKETVEELKRALNWLTAHDMRGLVLDLRVNPGGLLSAATGVCDLLIDSGVIVTTRGRDQQRIRQVYTATGRGTFLQFPMAVIVNRFSASASEIVAACLQDHHRAVIVGQRTWGKGTVQDLIDLEDAEGALKLTTASYWRPSGKNIHRGKQAGENDEWGVTPDEGYQVIVEGEALTKLRLQRLRRDVYKRAGGEAEPFVDPQLAKAVEYLEQELRKKK